jgi:hypothetical protein
MPWQGKRCKIWSARATSVGHDRHGPVVVFRETPPEPEELTGAVPAITPAVVPTKIRGFFRKQASGGIREIHRLYQNFTEY